MRFQLAVSLVFASAFVSESFTATTSKWGTRETARFSTTNSDHAVEVKQATQQGIRNADIDIDIADIFPMPETRDEIVALTADEINGRLNQQLAKLQAKDQTSKQLCKEVRRLGHSICRCSYSPVLVAITSLTPKMYWYKIVFLRV